eukprot:1145378-Pelagomonas_calceolata.AAC.7
MSPCFQRVHCRSKWSKRETITDSHSKNGLLWSHRPLQCCMHTGFWIPSMTTNKHASSCHQPGLTLLDPIHDDE